MNATRLIARLVQGRKDYIAQPDGSTCQSTAIGMVLGDTDIYKIRKALLAIGTPGDPAVMGAYLKPRVKDYKFLDAASLMDARSFLDQGKQLITCGWFSRSGHVIKLSGYEADPKTLSYKLIVDDPFGEYDFPSGNWINDKGNDVRYSSYGMYAFCVAGSSYSHARQIYKSGKLDSKQSGMWLHVITL